MRKGVGGGGGRTRKRGRGFLIGPVAGSAERNTKTYIIKREREAIEREGEKKERHKAAEPRFLPRQKE